MGKPRIRQLLVESAWTYRFPPRIGAKKLQKLDRVSPKIREIGLEGAIEAERSVPCILGRNPCPTAIGECTTRLGHHQRMMTDYRRQKGRWADAVARYHSRSPALAE